MYINLIYSVSCVSFTIHCIKLCFFFSSNHCWVSFTGFAEAYNDIHENSIEKHASLFMNDNMEAEGINNFSLSENNSRMVVNAIYASV